MKLRTSLIGVIALISAIGSGCQRQHVLIPKQGDATVAVYEDEDVFKAIVEQARNLQDPKTDPKMRPLMSMILNAAQHEVKRIDGGTKVKVISSDDLGSKVEVLEGKYIGFQGFVEKANLR